MRGVIMETKNGRAVLLTKGGEFVNIKDKHYSVGDKINITLNTGRLCAMAASLVIVCVGIGSYFTPAGYVSVDINPSLMITVNIYNRVIDVKSLNDDARVLLDKIDIKGKSAEDSVEMLIKASEDIGYINDNNRSVILDVVSGIIEPRIENVSYTNIDIIKETADMETFRTAQNMGVSVAKVKALEEYTEKNGGDVRSNAAKLNDKSVKEIQNIMLDNGGVSDKNTSDIPAPAPSPQAIKTDSVSKSSAARENYKRTYGISDNSAAVAEPKFEENTAAAIQPVLSEYIPAENISVQDDEKPQELTPALNEEPHWDITPTDNQSAQTEQKPQDNNISQSEPEQADEPEQQNPPAAANPIQPERKQDNTSQQSESKPQDGISESSESAPDNKQSANGQQITEQKPQDNTSAQDSEDTAGNPPQSDGQNPDAAIPSDEQPVTEQEPNDAEPDSDKPQDNPVAPDEPKREPVTEQSSQPTESDNDTYKPQNNPQPSEPAQESGTPRQPEPEPQNDGGNHTSNEGMGEHNENAQAP